MATTLQNNQEEFLEHMDRIMSVISAFCHDHTECDHCPFMGYYHCMLSINGYIPCDGNYYADYFYKKVKPDA